jgi:hypothetical protein
MPAKGFIRHIPAAISLILVTLLAGCSSRPDRAPPPAPEVVRSEIVRLLPASVPDRQGWATDIYRAFEAQKIDPTVENLCSVLAVTEQESNFQVDPAVPGMGKIAQDEIDRRASKLHIPNLIVRSALDIRSSSGKTYNQRLAAAVGPHAVRQPQSGAHRRADAGEHRIRRASGTGLSIPRRKLDPP